MKAESRYLLDTTNIAGGSESEREETAALDLPEMWYFRLTDESQLDEELAAFVREAYAVGCQETPDRTMSKK